MSPHAETAGDRKCQQALSLIQTDTGCTHPMARRGSALNPGRDLLTIMVSGFTRLNMDGSGSLVTTGIQATWNGPLDPTISVGILTWVVAAA